MLEEDFGFAEHQEKATYGLGSKLILTGYEAEAVLDKAAGFADAKTKTDHIQCYVAHFIPSVPQQVILSKEILNKTPAQLLYIERSVLMKEVKNQNLWNFELTSPEKMFLYR